MARGGPLRVCGVGLVTSYRAVYVGGYSPLLKVLGDGGLEVIPVKL